MSDDETFASMADEMRLISANESAYAQQLMTLRKLAPDDPVVKLARRRIEILKRAETLFRRAHEAGRKP